ncbi:hypothetical protein CTI12_AA225440 [Artemisia annua]|uniref:KIB1-4 beta-propeller domain-containing protein n=1 Tax=Artemisia annua TaxID=35608 RepID=A0A2U1NUZ7_ARTAN|nr:hypothetical protein CTI12_AA225440 [Artemisia annua]
MECISSGSVCDQLPPLSEKYSWLVSQSLEGTQHVTNDQFFYTTHDELPHYRRKIPELPGKRIHRSFHGWVIYSLIIRTILSGLFGTLLNSKRKKFRWTEMSYAKQLKKLTLDGELLHSLTCCNGKVYGLSTDCSFTSLVIRIDIMVTDKEVAITLMMFGPYPLSSNPSYRIGGDFLELNSKRKKFRWTEMSYAKQLKKLTLDGELLHSLTCCNGKVYGLSTDGSFTSLVIRIDIMVTDKEVAITLMMFGPYPLSSNPSYRIGGDFLEYLIGSCTELFGITICLEEETKKTHNTPVDVNVFKLDMTSIKWEEFEGLRDWEIINDNFEELDLEDIFKIQDLWEEMDDLKDSILCVDLAHDHSVSYSRVIASELGGYIHIRCKMGETIYSYHVKDNTISPWSIPSRMLPTSDASVWECRMECISSGSVCDQLPPLSEKYSWLVSQSLEGTQHVTNDQFFYTTHDELPHYRRKIPELPGKRIHRSFHGWVIYSLIIRTILSGLFGTLLNSKRKKFRWTEMSYAKQLKKLTLDGELLHSLTCCNGKVYGLSTDCSFTSLVIRIDIMVTDKEVAITLMMFGPYPLSSNPSYRIGGDFLEYLIGSCTELFGITICLEEETKKTHNTRVDVNVFKLDMTSIKWEEFEGLRDREIINDNFEELDLEDIFKIQDLWEEMDDLKDSIFCVDLARDHSVSYSRVIASELGEDDHGEAKCIDDSKSEMKNNNEILLKLGSDDGVDYNESHLLNIPYDLLELITEHCVGVEYMNFRATCKRCHLAAPLIKWGNKRSIKRLQTYSVVSPWLMVVDKKRDTITFMDPIMTCRAVLYNPFTNDLRKLPAESRDRFESLSFSAPPTSANCIVIGFKFKTGEHWHAHIHFVNREPVWHTLNLGPDPHTICSSIFDGRDLYALGKEGELIVFNNLGQPDHLWKLVEAEAPKSSSSSTQKYLTKCDQQLLLVSVGVGEYGEHVEVFKHNASKQEWEKVDGVGKHMIYICNATCLCIEAKMPQMENKIFFPQLHAENRKIVFYSLDTCMYHTFDGEDIQERVSGFFGNTFHFSSHAWLEPNWS